MNTDTYRIRTEYLSQRMLRGIIIMLAAFFLPGSVEADCSTLSIRISADGKLPQDRISLPYRKPIKYYLHISDATTGESCSMTYAVSSRGCDINSTSCGTWNDTGIWPDYKSTVEGILRLDMASGWNTTSPTLIQLRLRPLGSTGVWSNPVSVAFDHEAPTVPADMLPYWNIVPGHTYLYTNTIIRPTSNAGTGTVTRLQFEEETALCADSRVVVVPWRFTKNSDWAYLYTGQPKNDRWMVVSPSRIYAPYPAYNQNIWAYADKSYSRRTADPLLGMDLSSDRYAGGHFFASTSMEHSAYILSPKTLFDNFDISLMDGTVGGHAMPSPEDICSHSAYEPSLPPPGVSWQVRTEVIPDFRLTGNGFSYQGEALRVDYFEGHSPLWSSKDLLRESWYFVRNIGLVKIASKVFNNYADIPTSPWCRNDSDCISDDMSDPDTVTILNRYFLNPRLTVMVSADGRSYSDSIVTTPDQGYYITVEPPYVGYLETELPAPRRWVWIDMTNGPVKISTTGLGLGTYKARFRIWVPDDTADNTERRISDTTIPWSNEITVNEVNVLPTPNIKQGDANGDNRVDGLDYVIWLNHYGGTNTGVTNGDFNSDNRVDGLDYVIWLNNYGK